LLSLSKACSEGDAAKQNSFSEFGLSTESSLLLLGELALKHTKGGSAKNPKVKNYGQNKFFQTRCLVWKSLFWP